MAGHRNNVERRLAFLEKAYLQDRQWMRKSDERHAKSDERHARNEERLAKLMHMLLEQRKELREHGAAIRTIAHTLRRYLEGRGNGNGGGRER